MKCYIASPFFDKEGNDEIEEVKDVLKSFSIDFFSPKDSTIVNEKSSLFERKKAFLTDIEELNNCDFMIANTRNKDMGTLIEIGIFYEKGKPILLYCPSLKGKVFNLMLAQIFKGLAFDKNELIMMLDNFITGNLEQEYLGDIE